MYNINIFFHISATHVNEVQARQALLNLAGQNFCWSKKAAEDMGISSITSSSAFHVRIIIIVGVIF